MVFSFDKDALTGILNERAGEVNRDPQDAVLVRHGGQLIITDEKMEEPLRSQKLSTRSARLWARAGTGKM